MISTLNKNLNNIIKLFPGVFNVLENTSEFKNIRFYLIGGQLRDVWISHANLGARVTEDIDFSILLEEDCPWEELVGYLTLEQGLIRDPLRPYRFYLNREQIDLIPFGYLEKSSEIEILPPKMVISVDGFSVVKESFHLINDKYRVLHLEAFLLLKLISWSEKMYERKKDIDDFVLIVKYLQDINHDIIYEDIFRELLFEVDNEVIHARIIAERMKPIVARDQRIASKINEAVMKYLGGTSEAEINEQYEEYKAGNVLNDTPLRQKILYEFSSHLNS